MKNHLKHLILILILQACCKPELREQYKLSDKQREVIPYISEQSVKFITQSGYEFELDAHVEEKFIIPYNDCMGSCYYDEYETKIATLSSNYPELSISISSTALPEWEHEISTFDMELFVNYKYFAPQCETGRYIASDFADTSIDNRLYRNAMIFKLCYQNHSLSNDSTVFYFDEIIYTLENGIERISFTNNDYYELLK